MLSHDFGQWLHEQAGTLHSRVGGTDGSGRAHIEKKRSERSGTVDSYNPQYAAKAS